MGHGRNLRRVYQTEEGAPDIKPSQTIGKVVEIRDKGIVAVDVPRPTVGTEGGESSDGSRLVSSLAYLPPRFRGVLFIRRGKSGRALEGIGCSYCCSHHRV